LGEHEDAVVMLDPEGKLVFSNQAARNLYRRHDESEVRLDLQIFN
jgi:PAS domain-containing protein